MGFSLWYGQSKDCQIGICCYSEVRAKLTQNEDNVSEWSNMSTHRLLFQ